MEYGIGYIIIRSLYTPYSMYLRVAIGFGVLIFGFLDISVFGLGYKARNPKPYSSLEYRLHKSGASL